VIQARDPAVQSLTIERCVEFRLSDIPADELVLMGAVRFGLPQSGAIE
jgi:hypothetical protein